MHNNNFFFLIRKKTKKFPNCLKKDTMGNTNTSSGNIWTRPEPLVSFKRSQAMPQSQASMQDQSQGSMMSPDQTYMQNMENQMQNQMQNMENQMQNQMQNMQDKNQRRYDQNMQDYRKHQNQNQNQQQDQGYDQDQFDGYIQTSPERLTIKMGDRTHTIRPDNEGKFYLNRVMGPGLVYLTCDRGQIYAHGNRSGRIALHPDKRGRHYINFDDDGKVILQSHQHY